MLLRDGHPGLTDGRATGEGWQPQYSFTTDHVWDADLGLANHWTSTAPDSRFRQATIVSIVLPRGFAALTDRHYRRRVGQDETAATIGDPRVYRMRLSLMFGIDLTAEEAGALFAE
jgi:N-hydroxyarylamine O-acetyltransferase